MFLRRWEDLNDDLKNDEVKYYYDLLSNKKFDIILKRVFDFTLSLILLLLLLPILIFLSLLVKATSSGPILYKQERVTTYGKTFNILKFRTMVKDADKIGELVTLSNDNRITKIGGFLRKTRLDELPQLFNIIAGQMSFVGTRPEVQKYVNCYTDRMKATLLLPAGVTSLASITFKDESNKLVSQESASEIYINEILPIKMQFNIEYLEKFNLIYDLKLIIKTVIAVINE